MSSGTRWKRGYIWTIVLVAQFFISLEAQASCYSDIVPALKNLSARIAVLHQSTPKTGAGPQVEIGSCASRLRKLAGNFLCCKTSANTAAIWEEISCLELKKHYLRKSCECSSSMGGYTTDEALQDSVLETYKSIMVLRALALKRAVPNKTIRLYVKGMSGVLDCINYQTLQTLKDVERQLTDIIPKE